MCELPKLPWLRRDRVLTAVSTILRMRFPLSVPVESWREPNTLRPGA